MIDVDGESSYNAMYPLPVVKGRSKHSSDLDLGRVGEVVKGTVANVPAYALSTLKRTGQNLTHALRGVVDPQSHTFVDGVEGDQFSISILRTRGGERIKLQSVAPVDPRIIAGKFEHDDIHTLRSVDSVTFVSPASGKELLFVGAKHHLQSNGFKKGHMVELLSRFDAVNRNGEMFAGLIDKYAEQFLSQVANLASQKKPSIEELESATAVGELLLDVRNVLEDVEVSFGPTEGPTARLGTVYPWNEKDHLELLVDRYKFELTSRDVATADQRAESCPHKLSAPSFE